MDKASLRDRMVQDIENEGIQIVGINTVCFGE